MLHGKIILKYREEIFAHDTILLSDQEIQSNIEILMEVVRMEISG
jgi:hypothetical protein